MNTKPWYTSKLNWLGMVTFVVGVAELLGNSGMLSPEISASLLSAVGAAILILRPFTNKGVTL